MGTNMQDIQFLSTLSLRRATIPFVQFLLHTPISIHALLAESDGAATNTRARHLNFYPRSPCGERPPSFVTERRCCCISIHALLAESDDGPRGSRLRIILFLSTLSLRRATAVCANVRAPRLDFYPRSPCGERRSRGNKLHQIRQFLSTLSLRRATCVSTNSAVFSVYFYPRSPCGERLLPAC